MNKKWGSKGRWREEAIKVDKWADEGRRWKEEAMKVDKWGQEGEETTKERARERAYF